MSTRSRIAAKDENGVIHSIYCHFDGYPSGVGNVLYKFYTSEEKIFDLLNLGDISSLAETLEKVNAYHRDRGEDLNYFLSETEDHLLSIDSGEEYTYLYKDNEWYIFEHHIGTDKNFKLLKYTHEVD